MTIKMNMESQWEELLAEMRRAREHGVAGIGAREIAAAERKLEMVVRRNRESMRAIARMFRDSLERGKS